MSLQCRPRQLIYWNQVDGPSLAVRHVAMSAAVGVYLGKFNRHSGRRRRRPDSVIGRRDTDRRWNEVSTASTAERAIELLNVQEPKYRALVTDVQLGSENPTGRDIARRAREVTSDLPIVYVTGERGPEWASHGVPNSILVTKPFAPTQLLTAVSQLMNLSAPFNSELVNKGSS